MDATGIVKIVVLSIYALIIIVVGLFGMRRTKTFADYFLGGGKVGAIMTAFTYGTAYFSAVLFIGFAGKIGWGFGLSGLWITLGNALIGTLLVWWLIGTRIRRVSAEWGISTMGEFFEKRYNSKILKFFGAVTIFIFFIPYSAAVFKGLSYLFTENFGIPFEWAVILIGLFTAVYLVLGGYKSMTLIDLIFGIIMVAGVITLLIFTSRAGGGLAQITSDLREIDPKLVAPVGPPGWWPLLSLFLLTSIAPFAMPQLVQKFYAIKDEKAIRTGMIASTIFALLIGGVAYFTGATTRIFITPETAPDVFAGGGLNVDMLMPKILNTVVPDSLSILMLLLIMSASMSTLAALVLISSSSVAKDLYAGFFRPGISDRALTTLTRVMAGFFVMLSVVLAIMNPSTIVSILGISWGAIGSVFLGPFIWGLFWKKANEFGAVSSAVLGLATCLTLYFTGTPSPQAGTIGMGVSLVINPLFSLILPNAGRRAPKEIWERHHRDHKSGEKE
ncbi:MAG: sodium/solute symporter [Candidatus Cloacimonetes bacterium]|nr:sodium/solute symporter [Candidatus Cloacimonadota bacterium]